MWHASIAVLAVSGPIPTAAWTRQDRRRAARLAEDLLTDVGIESNRAEFGDFAYHLRRSLSSAEIAALDPEWLAIPAVDFA